MQPAPKLGPLQLSILRSLWQEREATVVRVHELLAGEGPRALTTIATMLTKLEKKGVVAHRVEGRSYIYRALVSAEQVQHSMIAELTESLFAGDTTALVSHLISQAEIDRDELAELKALIAEREGKPRQALRADGSAGSEEVTRG